MTLNQHCTFGWREFSLGERGDAREVDIEDHHCESCIADLHRLGVRIRDLRREYATG